MNTIPQWTTLQQLSESKSNLSLQELFDKDSKRAEKYSCNNEDLYLDYSKNLIDDDILAALTIFAQERQLKQRISDMFSGAMVNPTEGRPALHTLLRTPESSMSQLSAGAGENLKSVHKTLAKMRDLVESVHTKKWLGYSGKPISDVVNLGVGGSDLGPHLAVDALWAYQQRNLRTHFVSNIDGTDIYKTLKDLNPETTLFVVSSKSFGTLETLTNANYARNWLLQKATFDQIHNHFIAVTANTDKAAAFGIDTNNILPMWDWVGGRYSLWSAIGLSIALGLGWENFQLLLDGAHAMDEHFLNTPLESNMPVILALMCLWNCSIKGAQSYAVIPYSTALDLLPDYLQQLEMESNGKSVDLNGQSISVQSSPIIWGNTGTNSQHSFHQLLHQGKVTVPLDFILPLQSNTDLEEHHTHLVANCLSQSQALAFGSSQAAIKSELMASGKSEAEAEQLSKHQAIEGNKPHNLISFNQLTPYNLGKLIALYEHKVYSLSVFWEINAFDQWGVELGKKLSEQLFASLSDSDSADSSQQITDSSTEILVARFRQLRK